MFQVGFLVALLLVLPTAPAVAQEPLPLAAWVPADAQWLVDVRPAPLPGKPSRVFLNELVSTRGA